MAGAGTGCCPSNKVVQCAVSVPHPHIIHIWFKSMKKPRLRCCYYTLDSIYKIFISCSGGVYIRHSFVTLDAMSDSIIISYPVACSLLVATVTLVLINVITALRSKYLSGATAAESEKPPSLPYRLPPRQWAGTEAYNLERRAVLSRVSVSYVRIDGMPNMERRTGSASATGAVSPRLAIISHLSLQASGSF